MADSSLVDLEPEAATREVAYYTGRRDHTKHYPAAGNVTRVVYVEALLGHEDALDAKLAEVQAYAEPGGYRQLSWPATATAGRDPSVDVRVTVSLDAVDPSPAAEFDGLVVCEMDNNPDGLWDGSHGGAYLDVSEDSDVGDGSIQWGHMVPYPTMCGIQSEPGKFNAGSPMDCSDYNGDTDQIGIVIKMPAFTYFDAEDAEPIWIELGTDFVNTTRWVLDPAALVAAGAGHWVTLWADIGDGDITMGSGAGDLSAINLVVIVVECTDVYQEVPVLALADRVLLRHAP